MIVNFQDLARLQYTRLLWKRPDLRKRFVKHWTDPRHPYRERFLEKRDLIERVLSEPKDQNEILDQELRKKGESLRAICREIPPVFGHFWAESK